LNLSGDCLEKPLKGLLIPNSNQEKLIGKVLLLVLKPLNGPPNKMPKLFLKNMPSKMKNMAKTLPSLPSENSLTPIFSKILEPKPLPHVPNVSEKPKKLLLNSSNIPIVTKMVWLVLKIFIMV